MQALRQTIDRIVTNHNNSLLKLRKKTLFIKNLKKIQPGNCMILRLFPIFNAENRPGRCNSYNYGPILILFDLFNQLHSNYRCHKQ